MAAQKKIKKKQTKSKRTAGNNKKPVKKTAKKNPAAKRKAPKKKKLAKQAAQKKVTVQAKVVGKKTGSAKTWNKLPKPVGQRPPALDTVALPREGRGTRSGGQSGDLQGLSRVEAADSESVDELLEEGNAFEADVVAGVEDAGDTDEKEVRTHEVPEDDVPDEYLDKE
jgi:hypothetical protein